MEESVSSDLLKVTMSALECLQHRAATSHLHQQQPVIAPPRTTTTTTTPDYLYNPAALHYGYYRDEEPTHDNNSLSSDSTTASGVLKHSTLVVNNNISSKQLPRHTNTILTPRSVDNMNPITDSRWQDYNNTSSSSSGSQKVRISKKKLKQIPSPYESQVSTSDDNTHVVNNPHSHKQQTEWVPPALNQPITGPQKEIVLQPVTTADNGYIPVVNVIHLNQPHRHLNSSDSSSGTQSLQQGNQRLLAPSTTGNSVVINGQPLRSIRDDKVGTALRQGCLIEGNSQELIRGQMDDVVIMNTARSDREKQQLSLLAKSRSEHGAPIRRVVQPKMVHSQMLDGRGSVGSLQQDVNTLTAAATAAAVAATTPFIKSQSDLETQVAGLVMKMNVRSELDARVDHGGGGRDQQAEGFTLEQKKQIDDLETQITGLQQRRIDQLEKLLELQQQELKTKTQYFDENTKLATLKKITQHQPPIFMMSDPSLNVSADDVQTTDRRGRQPAPSTNIYYKPVDNLQSHNVLHQQPQGARGTSSHSNQRPPLPQPRKQQHPLDTPAPRRSVPVATETKQPGKNLLEEILSHQNEGLHDLDLSKVPQSPEDGCRYNHRPVTGSKGMSPAVKKATNLINDLELLKDEMTVLLKKPVYKEPVVITKQDTKIFDQYLPDVQPLTTVVLPHNNPSLLPHPNPSLLPHPNPSDAQAVLDDAHKRTTYLQSNIDAIFRAREDRNFYQMIDGMTADSETVEELRLQTDIDNMIRTMQTEIQCELMTDPSSPQRPVVEVGKKPRKPTLTTMTSRRTGGPQTSASSRKQEAKPTGMMGRGRGRGVKGQQKQSVIRHESAERDVPRHTDKLVNTHEEDEIYLTHVYGRAKYQPHRTTQRAPYLHYNTTSRDRVTRGGHPVHVQGKEIKSTKTQTSSAPHGQPVETDDGPPIFTLQQHAPAQFYFSPIDGTALTHHPAKGDIPSTWRLSPTQGSLVPMAIPLGAPRTKPSSTHPVMITNPPTGARVRLDRVTVQPPITQVKEVTEVLKKPILSKQILPSVDIVTEPRLPSPQPNTSSHKPFENFPNFLSVTDKHQDEDTTEADDDDGEDEPVVCLPGISAVSTQPYHGPKFPPAPVAPLPPVSDLLTSDQRAHDVLERQAVDWIEQELMARIISEFYPPRPAESHPSKTMVDTSTDTDDNVDAIGAAGLQLFVDAGQPINTELVEALVKDVIAEVLSAMIGQHPGGVVTKLPPPQPSQPLPHPVMVPTPDVTPKHTPVPSPRRVISPPVTPPRSPSTHHIITHQPPERINTPSPDFILDQTLSEVSLVSEGVVIAGPSSAVTTPIPTPQPSPVQPATPELSIIVQPSIPPPVDPVSPEPSIVDEEELKTLTPIPEPEPLIHVSTPPPTPPRTPPPAPIPVPQSPSPSSLPSDSTSTTVQTTYDTTTTTTTDDTVSEGEWLVLHDRLLSEGEQAPVNVDEAIRSFLRGRYAGMGHGYNHSPPSESTLIGTEDIEADPHMFGVPGPSSTANYSRTFSEGELDPRGVQQANIPHRGFNMGVDIGPPTHFLAYPTNDDDSFGEMSPGVQQEPPIPGLQGLVVTRPQPYFTHTGSKPKSIRKPTADPSGATDKTDQNSENVLMRDLESPVEGVRLNNGVKTRIIQVSSLDMTDDISSGQDEISRTDPHDGATPIPQQPRAQAQMLAVSVPTAQTDGSITYSVSFEPDEDIDTHTTSDVSEINNI